MFFYFFISTYHLVSLFFSSYVLAMLCCWEECWGVGVQGLPWGIMDLQLSHMFSWCSVHHSERERDKDWETFIVVHHHDALYNVKPWVICNLTTLWHSECNQQSLMGANQRHLSAVCKQTHTHFTCHLNEPETEASAINGHKYWAGDLKKKKNNLCFWQEKVTIGVFTQVLYFILWYLYITWVIPC